MFHQQVSARTYTCKGYLCNNFGQVAHIQEPCSIVKLRGKGKYIPRTLPKSLLWAG